MASRRETRSLDIRRQSFDRLDRRRSAELCRSTRRYDEYWGAAEKSDTRLKCGDGIIHHVHSQMCILWSPVLRDMINLYPTPNLLESTHGLAYLLHVEEDAATWAAVLDMIYPVTLQQAATDWELLERCLLLCDKYDMAVLLQRLAGRLTEPCCSYSTDPSQPNFALRWLRLAERLQLPEVSARILAYLREGLAQLGSQPDASAAVLAYAQEHLSKEQLLQLLQISMQAASSHQQQQSAQQAGFMQPQAQQMFLQPQQQMTLSTAFNGWLGQGQGQGPSSSGSQGFGQQQQAMQQQHHLRLGWQQPVPLFNQGTQQQQQQQQQQHAGASTTCSGTSSDPTVGESALCSDEGSSDNGDAAADSQQQQQQAVHVEQHRLKLCMSSGLFASALPQQQQQQQQQWPTCLTPAATPGASFAAPVPARSVSAACPVPRFPVGQAAGFVSLAPRAQLVPQQALGMQAASFGFGVNGGSASIADWMRSQPEGMCLS